MKVLLGIGGSDDSLHALERTVARAKGAGDELTVAIVDNVNTEASPDEIEGRVNDVLARSTYEAEVRHISGDPGPEIVDLAEEEGYDQIALGGGETSPMGKINIGQIAEFVLLNSHVTVTLVR